MVDAQDERLIRVARAATKLRRASSRLQRRLRSEGRRDGGGLSPGGASVLANLQRVGPATPGDLAAADAIRPQSMTRILHDLEADGLVARNPDPDDARRQRIAITHAGTDALTAEARDRDGWLAGAMTLELSPVERQVLVLAADLMDRLSELPRPVPSGPGPGPAGAHVPARAVPILPTHDAARTAAFFRHLGFVRERGSDDGYQMFERDGIELHYTLVPDVDPFTTAGVTYISVPDVDAIYDELVAAGVPGPFGEGHDATAALRARWTETRDLSRVGPPADKPWRVRELALADPTNNLLRIGQPIGLNRRRQERRIRATPEVPGQSS
jgi:DNA-binding MarR family transcriptional regulator